MSTLILITCSLLTLACLYLARRRDSDDLAAGVDIGQASELPPQPWPAKHFVAACMYCHHVTRSDGLPVRAGDELRVSHGICPRCMAAKHPEVAEAKTAADLIYT